MNEQPNPNTVSNDMTSVFRNLPNTKSSNAGRSMVVYTGSIVTRKLRTRWLLAAPAIVTLIVAGLAVQTREFKFGYIDQFSRVALAPNHQPSLPIVRVAAITTVAYPAAQEPTPSQTVPISLPAVQTATSDGKRHKAAEGAPARRIKQAQLLGNDPALPTRSSRLPRASNCRPDSLEDACIYADVMRADQRLRAAYTEAVRIGVPEDMMSGINRRWKRAQALSPRQPDEAIRQYDALAGLLDDYIAGEQ